jgi:hypothetical protein
MEYDWPLILNTARLLGYSADYSYSKGYEEKDDLVYSTIRNPKGELIYGGIRTLEEAERICKFDADEKFIAILHIQEVYYFILKNIQWEYKVLLHYDPLPHLEPV